MKNDAAQIYGSAFPANVKNLYIVGSNQPRNGFGNIITPAAALYARLIELQDQIEHPIGAVLRWQGEPLPETNLVDPGAAKREIWASHHLLWVLKLQAARLAKRERWQGPPAEFLGAAAAPVDATSAEPRPRVGWVKRSATQQSIRRGLKAGSRKCLTQPTGRVNPAGSGRMHSAQVAEPLSRAQPWRGDHDLHGLVGLLDRYRRDLPRRTSASAGRRAVLCRQDDHVPRRLRRGRVLRYRARG